MNGIAAFVFKDYVIKAMAASGGYYEFIEKTTDAEILKLLHFKVMNKTRPNKTIRVCIIDGPVETT